MPNISEIIRAKVSEAQAAKNAAEKAEKDRVKQMQDDEKTIAQSEKKRLQSEKISSKQAMSDHKVVEILHEINDQFLRGHGKVGQISKQVEYGNSWYEEPKEFEYRPGSPGGWMWESVGNYGVTIAELIWKKDKESNKCIQVISDSDGFHVNALEVSNNRNLNDIEALEPPKQEKTIPLNDEGVGRRLKENIAEAYMELHEEPKKRFSFFNRK